MPIWPRFVDSYLEAALWTAVDSEGDPLDGEFTLEDFDQAAIDEAVKDSNKFIRENKADLESVGSQEQHGHDFSLARNGHGSGFWDRGHGDAGKRLTKAAEAYKEVHVYVADGKLHFE